MSQRPLQLPVTATGAIMPAPVCVSSSLNVERALDHRLPASLVFLPGAKIYPPSASRSILAPANKPTRVKILASS